MAALSAPDRTLWTTHPYIVEEYLYVDKPPIVFAARVNQASFTYPIVTVTFDGTTTGAYTDIEVGQTILFGTSAGAEDLGRQRIRKAPTSTVIYVGESSYNDHDGELALVDNAYITVIDDRRIWAVHPRYTKSNTTQYKDYEIEVVTGGRNYNLKPGPKANGGCWRAGLIDSVTSLCTFTFDSTDSLSLSSGIAISSRLWDVGDGTITVGTSASTAITATFPIGRRYVTLTVTDADGYTHTEYILVVALSLTHATWKPILSFEVVDDRDTDMGKTMSFIITEDVPPATYYDGVAVIYFEQETYGTTAGSLAGPATAEGIKFVGWHHTERESPEATFQGIQKGVEFRCVSTAARLAEIVLLPQLLKHKGSPDEWDEWSSPDVQRLAWYILRWHSTALDIADFLLPSGFDDAFKRWGTTAGDLWSQLQETGKARAHKVTCDKRGVLRYVGNVQIQSTADRTSTSITTIGAADVSAYSFERKRHPDLYWLDGQAITVGTSLSTIAALFAIAPGDAPGQGAQRSTFSNLIVDDQDQLNDWTGNEYARLTSPWQLLRLTLVHTGDAGIDPALMEWITVTLPSTSNRRGRGLTSVRCLPIEVNVSHSNDTTRTKEVEIAAWIEVTGYPATTRIVQSGGAGVPTTITPGTIIFPSTPGLNPASIAFSASPAVYALDIDGDFIARTRTQTGTPAWEAAIVLADFPTTIHEIRHFSLDSWNPKNAMYVFGANTATNTVYVFYVENLNAAAGAQTITQLWSKAIAGANTFGMVQSSINIRGGAYVGFCYPGGGNNRRGFAGVDSYGGVWRETLTIGDHSSFGTEGIVLGHHAASVATAPMCLVGTQDDVMESRDGGTTWSAAINDTPNWNMTHYPYHDNPNDMILYAGRRSQGSSAANIRRRNADGSWSNIAPIVDSLYTFIADDPLSAYKFHTYTENRLICNLLGSNASGAFRLRSNDGGDTWTLKEEWFSDPRGIGGWPYDPNVLFMFGEARQTSGGTQGIWWTANDGVLWNNMIGDWNTAIAGGYTGVAQIAPVWIS